MKIVFRVDASNRMGTGHLMRCLTLAETLRERGAETHFVCRAHPGNLIEMLQRQAIAVTVLPAPRAPKNERHAADYAAWLGVTQVEDAKQTIEALGGEMPDWLIVDHYGLDAAWEKMLRPHVSQLMVIDDFADRRHDCDLLLNQNYTDAGDERYQGLVPENCRILTGPRFALLKPEYALYRRTLRPRDGRVRRVLVFFGGADRRNMTALTLEALSAQDFAHLEVDVVIGANNQHRASLERQINARPLTKQYGPRPHLADLMAQADLAIGAGGSTTWERMCLGLPSLVMSLSENQRPICEALQQSDLIQHLDVVSSDRVTDLAEMIKELKGNPGRLLTLSKQNQLLVDGLGALRIAELLDPTPADTLRLRPAREHDKELYFNWANDPEVRKQSIQSEPISWEHHQVWFTGKLSDFKSRLFVLMAGSLPVGQIRFDQREEEALIDYSLDPFVRGRGWGAQLIAMGSAMMRQIAPIRLRADVKVENCASRAVFIRLGFAQAHYEKGGGTSRSIAILSDRSSWLNAHLPELVLNWLSEGHRVLWTHDLRDLRPGDFCFYLSCGKIVPADVLKLYKHNLVVHESDLPKGKGWSPLTWQILEGKNRIPVTLLEAEERVDSGVIYARTWLEFGGHELIEELRKAQAGATFSLCKRFVDEYPEFLNEARRQHGEESFYSCRRPSDSRLDPKQSIEDQFNLLRVVDNERYPAHFSYRGSEYRLSIKKIC